MDVDQIKQRTAWAWGQGEYGGVSELIRPAAEALREALEVGEGQQVLDIAAGDGNFAVACSRAGARVVASDLSEVMVERGRERTAAEGLEIEWLVADAEELPFEDGRFDVAGSVFGAMIAPRPEVAARELLRVVRPGGRAGLTAWRPDRFPVAMFALARRYMPVPDDMPMLEEWGLEDVARARLGPHAAEVRSEPRSLPWRADSLDQLRAQLENAPMEAAARQALDPDDFERLRGEQLDVARSRGEQPDGSIDLEAEYLLTVATKP